MKKCMKTLIVLLTLMLVLAGCGSSKTETQEETAAAGMNETEEAVKREAYNVSDYVKVENYKGIKLKKADVSCTKDELQAEIDSLVNGSITLKAVDRAAETGDTVNIDFVGKIDGEAFEGGSGEEYDLELGSSSFIPGFEDQLVGTKKGDSVDVNVTFPEEYPNNPDLAGKPAVFEVKVNEVKQAVTPKYNNKLVKNNTEYKTVEEFEKAKTEEISNNKIQDAMINEVMGLATFEGDLPESLVKYYKAKFKEYYEYMISMYYQTDLESYLAQSNMTMDQFYENLGIEDAVKTELVWKYIAEQEGIVGEGEDYEAYIKEQCEQYGVEEEEFLDRMDAAEIEYSYQMENAQKLVKENLIVE